MGQLGSSDVRPLCANCRHTFRLGVGNIYCSTACYNDAMTQVPQTTGLMYRENKQLY